MVRAHVHLGSVTHDHARHSFINNTTQPKEVTKTSWNLDVTLSIKAWHGNILNGVRHYHSFGHFGFAGETVTTSLESNSAPTYRPSTLGLKAISLLSTQHYKGFRSITCTCSLLPELVSPFITSSCLLYCFQRQI